MAGDWIPIRHSVPADEKTWRVTVATGSSLNEAFGAIVRAWLWADVHTTDGFAPMLTTEQLDHIVGLAGCANAMIEAGWLLKEGEGLRFPAFERHMGESARKRELNAARVRKHRAKAKTITEPLPTITSNALQDSTEEKREEKKKRVDPDADEWKAATKAMTSDGLNDDSFKTTWLDWTKHRRQRGAKLTGIARTRQIHKLEKMGLREAIASLEQSMTQGWIGLFEPKTKPDSPARAKAPPGKWAGR